MWPFRVKIFLNSDIPGNAPDREDCLVSKNLRGRAVVIGDCGGISVAARPSKSGVLGLASTAMRPWVMGSVMPHQR